MKVYCIYDHIEDRWLRIKNEVFYNSRRNAAIAVGNVVSNAEMSAKYHGNPYPVNLEIVGFTLSNPVSLGHRAANCEMTESVVGKLWSVVDDSAQ